jgi:hypothetical protein
MGILDTSRGNALAKPGVEGEGQKKQEPLARITPIKVSASSKTEMTLPRKRGLANDKASAAKAEQGAKERLKGYNPLAEGNGVEQHVGAELDQQQLDKLNSEKRRRQALMTQNVDLSTEKFTGLVGMVATVADRLTGSRLTNETVLQRIGSKLSSMFSAEKDSPSISDRQAEIRGRMATAIEGLVTASKEAQTTLNGVRASTTAQERLLAGSVAAVLDPQTKAIAGPEFSRLRDAVGIRGLERVGAEVSRLGGGRRTSA